MHVGLVIPPVSFHKRSNDIFGDLMPAPLVRYEVVEYIGILPRKYEGCMASFFKVLDLKVTDIHFIKMVYRYISENAARQMDKYKFSFPTTTLIYAYTLAPLGNLFYKIFTREFE
jgi:hypothetical protein